MSTLLPTLAAPVPPVAGSGVPARDDCVLRYVLERRAREMPDRDFLRLAHEGVRGESWSYKRFRDLVAETAAALATLGVKQGDTVTVWLPNGLEMVRVWFAINWLGAVYVPINTAYKGNLLAHVIANAGSKLIVASSDLVGRLADVERALLTTAVVIGAALDTIPLVPGLQLLPASALRGRVDKLPPLYRPI